MFAYQKSADINNNIQKYLMEKELNYSRFVLPSKEGEVSVIGKYAWKHYDAYKENFGDTFCSLSVENEHLKVVDSTDFDAFYYGISPRFNNSMIMSELAKLSLKNAQGLEQFITNNADLFMLHKGQEKYLPVMAKYFSLCMFYNFGIKIEFHNENVLSEFVSVFGEENPYLKIKDKVVTIHGCPTEEILEFLKKYRYIEKGTNLYCMVEDAEANSILDICNKEDGYGLVNGDVFYSGVLLRPVYIEERNVWNTNSNISSMCIYYERSTYGTVFSLDNQLMDHPLLTQEEKTLIKEFFEVDDKCKIACLSGPVESGEKGRKRLIEQINEYLKTSYNVNQIGVTGNIITSDNVLIYGKRASSAIDSGKLYPSVNGNAEIADLDVEFYSDSAEVDFPLMPVDSLPFRFGKELCRETEAELNISLSNNLWKCYGVSISGNLPESAGEGARRRMHFNVIFKQTINYTFDEIMEMQKSAVENYENGELHGVNIKVFENKKQWLMKQLQNVLQVIMDSRDIIGSILTVLLFYLSISKLEYSLDGLNAAISAFFAVLVLFTTINSVISRIKVHFKRKKYLHSVTIIKSANELEQKLDKASAKIMMDHVCHPVTYLAIRLHLLELATK